MQGIQNENYLQTVNYKTNKKMSNSNTFNQNRFLAKEISPFKEKQSKQKFTIYGVNEDIMLSKQKNGGAKNLKNSIYKKDKSVHFNDLNQDSKFQVKTIQSTKNIKNMFPPELYIYRSQKDSIVFENYLNVFVKMGLKCKTIHQPQHISPKAEIYKIVLANKQPNKEIIYRSDEVFLFCDTQQQLIKAINNPQITFATVSQKAMNNKLQNLGLTFEDQRQNGSYNLQLKKSRMKENRRNNQLFQNNSYLQEQVRRETNEMQTMFVNYPRNDQHSAKQKLGICKKTIKMDSLMANKNSFTFNIQDKQKSGIKSQKFFISNMRTSDQFGDKEKNYKVKKINSLQTQQEQLQKQERPQKNKQISLKNYKIQNEKEKISKTKTIVNEYTNIKQQLKQVDRSPKIQDSIQVYHQVDKITNKIQKKPQMINSQKMKALNIDQYYSKEKNPSTNVYSQRSQPIQSQQHKNQLMQQSYKKTQFNTQRQKIHGSNEKNYFHKSNYKNDYYDSQLQKNQNKEIIIDQLSKKKITNNKIEINQLEQIPYSLNHLKHNSNNKKQKNQTKTSKQSQRQKNSQKLVQKKKKSKQISQEKNNRKIVKKKENEQHNNKQKPILKQQNREAIERNQQNDKMKIQQFNYQMPQQYHLQSQNLKALKMQYQNEHKKYNQLRQEKLAQMEATGNAKKKLTEIVALQKKIKRKLEQSLSEQEKLQKQLQHNRHQNRIKIQAQLYSKIKSSDQNEYIVVGTKTLSPQHFNSKYIVSDNNSHGQNQMGSTRNKIGKVIKFVSNDNRNQQQYYQKDDSNVINVITPNKLFLYNNKKQIQKNQTLINRLSSQNAHTINQSSSNKINQFASTVKQNHKVSQEPNSQFILKEYIEQHKTKKDSHAYINNNLNSLKPHKQDHQYLNERKDFKTLKVIKDQKISFQNLNKQINHQQNLQRQTKKRNYLTGKNKNQQNFQKQHKQYILLQQQNNNDYNQQINKKQRQIIKNYQIKHGYSQQKNKSLYLSKKYDQNQQQFYPLNQQNQQQQMERQQRKYFTSEITDRQQSYQKTSFGSNVTCKQPTITYISSQITSNPLSNQNIASKDCNMLFILDLNLSKSQQEQITSTQVDYPRDLASFDSEKELTKTILEQSNNYSAIFIFAQENLSYKNTVQLLFPHTFIVQLTTLQQIKIFPRLVKINNYKQLSKAARIIHRKIHR